MIRKSKQTWEPGEMVRVGFLTLRVCAKVATPGNCLPDQYALADNNGRFYRFVPHNGLTRCTDLADAMEPA